ncbi:WASH complex subunit 2 [Blattella germanica]|nr:WASH complex subunit 2 [Blattella germanica]
MEESKDPVKPWERPWSTEEMRQQSGNWNLAGDAGLLKHLQEFSQNLLAQTHATEVALDSLMEQLRATSTDVSNVTNQFLCLANTQFVENRVYDDDEKETPPEEKKEEEKVSIILFSFCEILYIISVVNILFCLLIHSVER